jgi:hypothetical protein
MLEPRGEQTELTTLRGDLGLVGGTGARRRRRGTGAAGRSLDRLAQGDQLEMPTGHAYANRAVVLH